MANKFTTEDYENRIKLSFPEWEFEILKFDGYKRPTVVKCKKCGNIIELKKGSDITRKINICNCTKTFKDFHEKIEYLGERCEFEILEDGPATQKKKIRCKKCGTIMYRSLVSILNTPNHCSKCCKYREGISHYTKEEIQKKLDEEIGGYTILEFKGMTKDALLRHSCGMIFKIRELGDLFNGRNKGCPKCYKNRSKGELKIEKFLLDKKIPFVTEYSFQVNKGSYYRFDFYLEDKKIAIEYNGEQHYRENHFFKDSLDTIQKRDAIKKQYCLDNNIELIIISYKDFKKINAILLSRFND